MGRSLGKSRRVALLLAALAVPLLLLQFSLLRRTARQVNLQTSKDLEERMLLPQTEERRATSIVVHKLPREVVFTPEEFAKGNKDKYVNLPVLPANRTEDDVEAFATRAINQRIDEPHGLLHEASPTGADVVMGLAAWPTAMNQFKRFVGSLRGAGYDGHIILGVHSEIPANEREYLVEQNVTFYAVQFVECDESIAVRGSDTRNTVRGFCSKGIENLKLEWGRFLMARQWLHACKQCTGWALVADTRDLFFQTHPFAALPNPHTSPHDLMFIEEVSKHTCPKPDDPKRYYILGNSHYTGRPGSCYGQYHLPFNDRPVLCSGTIIGTRKGMDRFLAVFVDELHSNNKRANAQCRSPHLTDQLTLNYMYYNGLFGGFERTVTSPWGTGPINTIGHVCVDNNNPDPNKRHSAKDMVTFDDAGLILNAHEGTISPGVHQWDRCHAWIHPFFREHPCLFDRELSCRRDEKERRAKRQTQTLVEKKQKETPKRYTGDQRCLFREKQLPPLPVTKSPYGLRDNPLRRIYKVHLWDDKTYCSFREELYVREGFHLHPNTVVVESPDEADVIVWATSRARQEAEQPPENHTNVVLLDYADGCSIHQFRKKLKHEVGYFKRSRVKREDGVYNRSCTADESVLPFAYSGAEALVNRNSTAERQFVVTNLLRPAGIKKANGGVRARAISWTRAFIENHNLTRQQALVGQIGLGTSGSDWSEAFMNHMANSKIVVTANPKDWEGDFRLWEALLSGALVFVDRMRMLDMMPHPFVHGKHLIFYDPLNETAFHELLEYYVNHEDEARAIALAGYQHTLDYHMAVSRVTHILSQVESKLVMKDTSVSS